MSGFPRVHKRAKGYSVEQVDAFLDEVRAAYESWPSSDIRADHIRRAAFDLTRAGYQTAPVDAALERLEDVFAGREREKEREQQGDDAIINEARKTAKVIVQRLSRPEGRRFSRTSVLGFGYNRSDVDRFTRRVLRYFQQSTPLGVDDVRQAVFRPQRGGYHEHQVDVLLDDVVDVMLAVR